MTSLLKIERECDREGCINTFTPTGDGTIPFLSTDMGGVYFCSTTCRDSHIVQPNALTQLTKAFAAANLPSPETAAKRFLAAYTPRIAEQQSVDNTKRFAVTIVPEVSLISCIISGDSNIERHTGAQGTTQTLVRIADFAGIVNILHPHGTLVEIKNVRLSQSVPLGATVIVTMNQLRAGRGLITYEVSATLEASTVDICRPTTITVKL